MGNKNENLIGHIINAFIYTFAGFKTAWKNELAFRGEVVVIMIMSPLGLWLGRSAVERALLIASLLLIIKTGQRHGLCRRIYQYGHGGPGVDDNHPGPFRKLRDKFKVASTVVPCFAGAVN